MAQFIRGVQLNEIDEQAHRLNLQSEVAFSSTGHSHG
jgi:hypothetical protein